MIIIHHMNSVPRLATRALVLAIDHLPVTVVTGARQTGKTTLVRDLVGDKSRHYLTLDDLDVLDQATRSPDDVVERAPKLTLDEVQRAPHLLLAVKRAVDRRRTHGQFVLTGSANLLAMRDVADSLAGRAVYVTLWPLTRREQLGFGTAGLWSELIAAPDESWREVLAASEAPPANWRDVAQRGGFPTPAIELETQESRDLWFAGYLRTYLERDLRELASISNVPDFRHLMQAAALRVGQLINQTELGRDVALAQPTVHRWLNLLELSYQIVRLPAYSVNRTKRLIKTPKLYWADPGLGLHIAGGGTPQGAHLENIVLHDLLVWRESLARRPEICYWRTATGEEVDFVIDLGTSVCGIEVKATRRPTTADIRTLQSFRADYGARARPSLLLHDGDVTEWLAPGILSAPWWRVL